MKLNTNKRHEIFNSLVFAIATSVICLIVASCATGSGIRTGRVLSPTSPETIRVLTKHPNNYETIGLVEASTEEGLFESGSGAGQRALEELKSQAADLGATAIVLKDYGGDSSSDFVIDADTDLGVITNSERKRISGEAIYIRK